MQRILLLSFGLLASIYWGYSYPLPRKDPPVAPPIEWRRTVMGWERKDRWQINNPKYEPLVSPDVIAGLLVMLSGIALVASDSSRQDAAV